LGEEDGYPCTLAGTSTKTTKMKQVGITNERRERGEWARTKKIKKLITRKGEEERAGSGLPFILLGIIYFFACIQAFRLFDSILPNENLQNGYI